MKNTDGYVKLISSTGNDLSVANAARVSYQGDGEWRGEPDEKLIRYLIRNAHTSPFEHVTFTFEVQAPIFVLRQWMRHRTWSYNEVSGRYTELDFGYFFPEPRDIGVQSENNKQVRADEENVHSEGIRAYMEQATEYAAETYKVLLDLGCPRELARIVLPLNTMSRMYATVDLHNLLHFLKLRLHEHSQKEIRMYAEEILKLVEPIVPVTIKAWKEHEAIRNQ